MPINYVNIDILSRVKLKIIQSEKVVIAFFYPIGRTIIDMANIFDVDRRTIERWFDKWEKEGLNSLPIMTGRGVKTRLKGLEEVLSKLLEIHSRNLKNVLLHLEEKHNIRICKKTLQNFLKDTGL